MSNVWIHHGSFYQPGTTSLQVKKIPSGLYQWCPVPGGWVLQRTGDRFEFPWKVYGVQTPILDRIGKAFNVLPGNLGVLLNGLKGTGKTVTAQLVANWAVDSGMPVIVAHGPIPLDDVLAVLDQPAMVLFDEFEKTHDADAQKSLLSALDGTGRSAHNRLFVFTTNEAKLDPNMVDRPSRVRYLWTFGRLTEDVIDELMTDLLAPDLAQFRSDIQVYLSTREVLSIDVAKAVISEVNAFREAPNDFAEVMNLREAAPGGWKVDLLDADDNAIQTIHEYWTPNERSHQRLLQKWTSRSGHEGARGWFADRDSYHLFGRDRIDLLEPTDDPAVWLASVQVPSYLTWMDEFPFLRAGPRFLDERPAGWAVPAWAAKVNGGKALERVEDGDGDVTPDCEQGRYDTWRGSATVHGGKIASVRIRFTAVAGFRFAEKASTPSYGLGG